MGTEEVRCGEGVPLPIPLSIDEVVGDGGLSLSRFFFEFLISKWHILVDSKVLEETPVSI